MNFCRAKRPRLFRLINTPNGALRVQGTYDAYLCNLIFVSQQRRTERESLKLLLSKYEPQGADPPPPLHPATAGKNHLNEEITPLLPTGIGERYCQTILNSGHAALLR